MAGTITVSTMADTQVEFEALNWDETLPGAFSVTTERGTLLIPWHYIGCVDMSEAELEI